MAGFEAYNSFILGQMNGNALNLAAAGPKVGLIASGFSNAAYAVVYDSINGLATMPNLGTGLVYCDPESYFLTDSTQMNIAQG